MLRASAITTNTEVDIQGVNDDASAAAKGVEFGSELMKFAEAVATGARSQSGVTVNMKQVSDITQAEIREADAIIIGSPVWKRQLIPTSQFPLNLLPTVKLIICLESQEDGTKLPLLSSNSLQAKV